MAVTATNLETSGDNVDRTSYSTSSISPASNALILAWVYSIVASPNTPTATGNGLTWVEVATIVDSGTNRRLTLFRAMGVSPTSGAVTFDFAGQTQTGCTWSVIQYSGVDIRGTNGSNAVVQSATAATPASDSSLIVTLAAFASTANATAGGFGYPLNNGNGTNGSGFTQTAEHFQGSPNQATYTEFRSDNDTTVDMSIGVSSVPMCGIAVELAVATNTGNFFAIM